MILDAIESLNSGFDSIEATLAQIQAKQDEQSLALQDIKNEIDQIENKVDQILIQIQPPAASKLVLTIGKPIPQ